MKLRVLQVSFYIIVNSKKNNTDRVSAVTSTKTHYCSAALSKINLLPRVFCFKICVELEKAVDLTNILNIVDFVFYSWQKKIIIIIVVILIITIISSCDEWIINSDIHTMIYNRNKYLILMYYSTMKNDIFF